ncbi:MAG: DUF2058 domain-containing protein [Pseudomonadota bacterium]
MGNSLQEQLLKAGLTTKHKAAKARKANKVAEQAKRAGKAPSESDAQRAAREAAEAKAERDRALNQQRNAEREANETAAHARNIIEHAAVAIDSPDTAFNFSVEGVIKTLHLAADQHRHVASGRLAIAAGKSGFTLIPAVAADKVQSRLPELILCWHQGDDAEATDESDPYAGYEIPDDLMW